MADACYYIVPVVKMIGKVCPVVLPLPFDMPYKVCFGGLFNDASNIETTYRRMVEELVNDELERIWSWTRRGINPYFA
jgi:hypothetical protein